MFIKSHNPLKNFFQHGYVTNDFERAKRVFSDYGITNFLEMPKLDVQIMQDQRAKLSIGLAYFGSLQIEIIQPEEGDCQIHRDILPDSGFALRLHHHGFLLFDEQEFTELRDSYAARGAPTVIDGRNPRSGNRYFYADTRAELGHYVEYIYLTPQGVEDYARIPQNAIT